jgi:hypothetical protein
LLVCEARCPSCSAQRSAWRWRRRRRGADPSLEDYPARIIETLRFADADRNGHITSSVFTICCQIGRLALLSNPCVLSIDPR